MSSRLFHFHFNLRALVWWVVNGVLNNCKKGKIFLSKYAIYRKFQISSFGLTCFAKPRLASTYLCSFCSQVSKGEKNWGTWKRRLLDVPHRNVHKTFRLGRLSVFPNWTKYERPFVNVFCTYIFGSCVYWEGFLVRDVKLVLAILKAYLSIRFSVSTKPSYM